MAPQAPTFIEFLQQIEDGSLQADLTQQLADLVHQMHRQAQVAGGKPKGKLTLAIDMKLVDGVYEVNADVAVKTPKPIRTRSIFYRTADDRLSANNPRQLELGVETRDVSSRAAADVRVVR